MTLRQVHRIIWVAARLPLAPFGGVTLTTVNGLSSLLDHAYDVHLVALTGAEGGERHAAGVDYWRSRGASVSLVAAPDRRLAPLRSRFAFRGGLDRPALEERLDALGWTAADSLVVMDDIVLAPLMEQYGGNAVLSPHDCMSAVFDDQWLRDGGAAARAAAFVRRRLAARYERTFYHRALLVHLVADRDRTLLERINPLCRFHVIPNAAQDAECAQRSAAPGWDIVVWADLSIAALASDARRFLQTVDEQVECRNWRIAIAGRVDERQARRRLGLRPGVHSYFSTLEDMGGLRAAKVVVVPDLGGAGIKNRCVVALASGACLACTYRQMEGLAGAQDIAAVNAVDHDSLARQVSRTLADRDYTSIGEAGRTYYQGQFAKERMAWAWRDMVERAAVVRQRSFSVSEARGCESA